MHGVGVGDVKYAIFAKTDDAVLECYPCPVKTRSKKTLKALELSI